MTVSFTSLPGTSIGRVSAYDPDGTSVTYSLESQARNYLEIDPNTGDIKIKVRLDAELSTVCELFEFS